MNKPFAFLLIMGCYAGFAQADGIVADTNTSPYFDPPALFFGKPIWNLVNTARHREQMAKMYQEPFMQNSFTDYARIGNSLIERERSVYNRLVFREIELCSSSGENIAKKAKVTAFAEGNGVEMRYPERITDGDLSVQGACYSVPPKNGDDQKGWVEFDFGKPETLSGIIVRSGRPRAAGSPDYTDIAGVIAVQKKNEDGTWTNLAALNNNTRPDLEIPLGNISARTFRVKVDGQGVISKISAMRLLAEKPGSGTLPFNVPVDASRPPFLCFETAEVDKTGYEEWKKQNPNFAYFYIGEWDTDFGKLVWNNQDSLKARGVPSHIRRRISEKFANPVDRQAAIQNLKAYFDAIRDHFFGDAEKLMFIDCSLALSHYAYEWGAGYNLMETTSVGVQRHQIQNYFTRGAAHQYHKPWGWYIALGMIGNDPKTGKQTYVDPDYQKMSATGAGGPDGGSGPSLNRRDRYLAWLTGASTVSNEALFQAYFMDRDGNGLWELTPHGEVMKEWWDFILKHPERGVAYAPVAIGVHFDHGWSPIQGGRAFAILPNDRNDLMLEATLRTIVPWKMYQEKEQEWSLAETPYGDLCDILLPDPPSGPVGMDVLKNYRVLFLSGLFDPSPAFAKRLMEYVGNGGTLIINTTQIGKNLPVRFLGAELTGERGRLRKGDVVFESEDNESFRLMFDYDFDKIRLTTARKLLADKDGDIMICLNRYGKGHVILTTPDRLVNSVKLDPKGYTFGLWPKDARFQFMDWLFGKISKEVFPIEVKNPMIQYGLNIVHDGLLLYLINNNGVSKTAFTAEKLDSSKTLTVPVDLRKLKVPEVIELRSGKKIAVGKDNVFRIDVGPGDVAVVKIPCGELK